MDNGIHLFGPLAWWSDCSSRVASLRSSLHESSSYQIENHHYSPQLDHHLKSCHHPDHLDMRLEVFLCFPSRYLSKMAYGELHLFQRLTPSTLFLILLRLRMLATSLSASPPWLPPASSMSATTVLRVFSVTLLNSWSREEREMRTKSAINDVHANWQLISCMKIARTQIGN